MIMAAAMAGYEFTEGRRTFLMHRLHSAAMRQAKSYPGAHGTELTRG